MMVTPILCSLLLSRANLAQDTVTWSRTWVKDSKASYDVKMEIKGRFEVIVGMSMTQKVLEVFDKGEAMLETAIDKFEVTVMGNSVPAPAPPTTKSRVDKYGNSVEKKTGNRNGLPAFWNTLSMDILTADFTVGTKKEFEREDKNAKTKSKGWVKFASLEKGVATVEYDVYVTSPDSEKPFHVVGSNTINATNGSLIKAEGTVTDPPKMQNMEFESIKFQLTLKQ